jgi:hypothetical protein
MSTHQEIHTRFLLAKDMIKQEKYTEGVALLDSAIQDLTVSNYFPLLDQFLGQRQVVSAAHKHFSSYIIDGLLRLSPLVRSQNTLYIFRDLLHMLERAEASLLTLDPQYLLFFPISLTMRYIPDRVIAGAIPRIQFSVDSNLPLPFKIDSLDLVLTHDRRDVEEYFQVAADLTLKPRVPNEFTINRNLPPAIERETIKAVMYTLKKLKIKVKSSECSLNVSPDASACKVTWDLPAKCVAGADAKLVVHLQAAEQKLQHILISFSRDPSIPLSVLGRYRGIELGFEPAGLPDVEPNVTCDLEFLLQVTLAVFIPLQLNFVFGTSLSGRGEFKYTILLDFRTPFIARIRYLDSAAQELSFQSSLVVESGSCLFIETNLTNNLDCDVQMMAIKGSLVDIETGPLPATIWPGEVFTFIGKATRAGQAEISVVYDADVIGQCAFPLKTFPIEYVSRTLLYTIESPSNAVRFQKFETKLIMEVNPEGVNPPDVTAVTVEVQTIPEFFVEGPTKRTFHVFFGQKTVVPINFIALFPGTATLPLITVTDGTLGPTEKPKTFSVPIVIMYAP